MLHVCTAMQREQTVFLPESCCHLKKFYDCDKETQLHDFVAKKEIAYQELARKKEIEYSFLSEELIPFRLIAEYVMNND